MNAAPADYLTKLEDWLQNVLATYHGTSGTIHLCEDGGLKLATAINIPPQVQQVVAWVPNGKGMAGLALQNKEPIHTCNLQEDRSGNVKPGAKAVNAQAAVALPVFDSQGEVRAVIGLAFQEEREFTGTDLDALVAAAATLPESV